MVKLGFSNITAVSDVHGLNILKLFADAVKIYARKRVILVFHIVISVDVKGYIFCTRRSFFDLFYLIKFLFRPFYKLPPRIIGSAASAVVPFINIDSIRAQAFDLRLDIMLKAVNSG